MKHSWLMMSSLLLLSGAALADTAPAFEEGASYEAVTPAQPTEAKAGQVEVIEFFWYGCPVCFALEPHLEVWLKSKPKYVLYRHIPAAMKDSEFYTDSQAFYTAELLGISDKIHEPFFNAIHLDGQGELRTDVDALRSFFGKYGVAPKDFDATWNSFAVQTKMSEAAQIEVRYGITGVPSIVVDGKWKTGAGYRLPSGAYMKGDDIMRCVDFLVKREHAAQASKVK